MHDGTSCVLRGNYEFLSQTRGTRHAHPGCPPHPGARVLAQPQARERLHSRALQGAGAQQTWFHDTASPSPNTRGLRRRPEPGARSLARLCRAPSPGTRPRRPDRGSTAVPPGDTAVSPIPRRASPPASLHPHRGEPAEASPPKHIQTRPSKAPPCAGNSWSDSPAGAGALGSRHPAAASGSHSQLLSPSRTVGPAAGDRSHAPAHGRVRDFTRVSPLSLRHLPPSPSTADPARGSPDPRSLPRLPRAAAQAPRGLGARSLLRCQAPHATSGFRGLPGAASPDPGDCAARTAGAPC